MIEYIGLNNLRNGYPSKNNYKSNFKDRIVFSGIFPENNIDFLIPNLENVQVISGTSFKFIIKLKFNEGDDTFIGLYTSPIFYNELLAAKSESNPYYLQSAFIDNFIVNFSISDITKTYTELITNEISDGVIINRNLFYTSNSIDIPSLIKYIDWVVSKPQLSEIDTNNVIPVDELGEYTFSNDVYVRNLDRVLRSERDEVERQMREISNYIQTPTFTELARTQLLIDILGQDGFNYLSNTDNTKIRESFNRIQLLPFSISNIGNITPTQFTLVNPNNVKSTNEIEIDSYTIRIRSELLRLSNRLSILELQINKLNE